MKIVDFRTTRPNTPSACGGDLLCVLGMTHRPQFQAKPGAIGSAVTGRKDDADKARAYPESGVSEGSMRQKLCT